MITASTIPDRQDSGALDLQLVEQLVELREIDSGAEAARLRPYAETREVAGRRRTRAQAAPKGLVDHDFQRLSRASRHRLQFSGDVVIERERRSHSGIMMPDPGVWPFCLRMFELVHSVGDGGLWGEE